MSDPQESCYDCCGPGPLTRAFGCNGLPTYVCDDCLAAAYDDTGNKFASTEAGGPGPLALLLDLAHVGMLLTLEQQRSLLVLLLVDLDEWLVARRRCPGPPHRHFRMWGCNPCRDCFPGEDPRGSGSTLEEEASQ